MTGVLVLLFLVVPVVELAVILQVGSSIGLLNTVGLLVLMSVAGGWLMKREGLSVLRRVRDQLAVGRVPAREVVDGFLILFGGALMLTPGFVTDVVGLSLLVAPVRAAARVVLLRRFAVVAVGHRRPPGPAAGEVIDL